MPMNRHHRKCKSRGGRGNKRNISIVDRTKHEAYHVLFADCDPVQVANILNTVWLDPDWHFVPHYQCQDKCGCRQCFNCKEE